MSTRQKAAGQSRARAGKRPSQGKANGRRTRSPKRARLEDPKKGSGRSTSAPMPSSSRATTKRKPRGAVSGANGGSAPREAKQLFLSYGHEGDVNDFAKKLKEDLEEIGFTVWMDVDIPAGTPWVGGIGSGVHKCNGLIAVITNKYVNSEYCTSELTLAKNKKKRTCIFPVIYEENVDFTKEPHAPGVELIIGGLQWTYFRPRMDNYSKSFAKLVAGVAASGIHPGVVETTDFGKKTSSENGTNPESDNLGSSSGLDREPTDGDLEKFVATEIERFHSLGTMLHLKSVQINNIKQEERSIVVMNTRILALWKEEKTRKPITWRTLIEALRDMKMNRLADQLTEQFGQ